MILPPNLMHSGLEPPVQDFVSSKLFIGGLSYDTTDASLANYFRQFGDVASAIVLRDPVTAHSRGFGFVTFTNEQSAQLVLQNGRNHVVDGRKVEAKIAVPKNQTMPRKQLPSYNSYGMNLPPSAMGMNPYLMGGYDMNPMYNNQISMNNDVYNSMQNFGRSSYDNGYDSYNSTSAHIPTRFNERVNSMKSSNSNHSNQDHIPEEEDIHQTNLRRPTYPQIQTAHSPVNINKMRRYTMTPARLQALSEIDGVTSHLSGLNLDSSSDSSISNSIYVVGLNFQTNPTALIRFFTAFGSVEHAEILEDSTHRETDLTAIVTFSSPEPASEVLRYQQFQGKFSFDGSEVDVKSVHQSNHDDSNHEEFLGRPFARSNTLPLDAEAGLFDDDVEEEPPRSFRVPMLRAHSVSQAMFGSHSGYDIDDGPRSPTMDMIRDDKMRSMSFTSVARPYPLQRMQSDSGGGRRSSFANINENGTVFSRTNVRSSPLDAHRN